MKSVIISIRPKWCELIAAGKKTIEVRKDRPNINETFKAYIYQTKGKWAFDILRSLGMENLADRLEIAYGKIIGEFVCQEFTWFHLPSGKGMTWLSNTCLDADELFDYLGYRAGWGWHISDLVIYDEPKELSEFGLTRAPQNWCYTKEEEKNEQIH